VVANNIIKGSMSYYGISVSGSNNIIKGNFIEGDTTATDAGIYISSRQNIISDNHSFNSVKGFYLIGGANNNELSNNVARSSSEEGFLIEGESNLLTNCKALGNNLGIYIKDHKNVVSNSFVENKTGGDSGIKIEGATDCAIIGCICRSNTKGIEVVAAAGPVNPDRTKIVDCTCSYNEFGIKVDAGDYHQIVGNKANSNSNTGITVASSYCLVNNNIASNNGTGTMGEGINVNGNFNTISENSCHSNIKANIDITGYYAVVKGNNVSNSSTSDGLVVSSEHAVVSSNISGGNANRGINISSLSNYCVIENNRCHYNTGIGLEVAGDNNNIMNNLCTENDATSSWQINIAGSRNFFQLNHCMKAGTESILRYKTGVNNRKTTEIALKDTTYEHDHSNNWANYEGAP
jgi:parallel beta-helix repeat protein